MPLDATVGGVNANSYLTVAEADALNLTRPNYGAGSEAARWTAATTTQKEQALISATDDIDAHIRVGLPWDNDQRLRFPRAIDINEADAAFVPWRVKHATYEQAVYLLANQAMLEQAAMRRARQLFSFDEDGLSGSVALNSQTGLLAPQAELLLAPLVQLSTSRTRVGSIRVRSRYAEPLAVSVE